MTEHIFIKEIKVFITVRRNKLMCKKYYLCDLIYKLLIKLSTTTLILTKIKKQLLKIEKNNKIIYKMTLK